MKFIFYSCLAVLPFFAKAQRYYFYDDRYYYSNVNLEMGASLGFMNALTDLGGRKGIGKGFIKDLNMRNSQPCFSLYAAVNFSDLVFLRLEGSYGRVKAEDQILKPVKESVFGRYERNLSFRSTITELSLAAELHPLMFRDINKNAPRFSPYVTAGIGVFSFNPQARLGNIWHNLHGLRTEGQGFAEYPDRKQYNLVQVNVPVGMGVRYELSALWNLRFEIVHRILNTDYLDDVSQVEYPDPALFARYLPAGQASVAARLSDRRGELNPGVGFVGSQRGNPDDNDAFFSMQIKLGYTFRKRR
jgi:Domain of unknown function (DUF6089)